MTQELWMALVGRLAVMVIALTVFVAVAVTSRPAVPDYPQAHMRFRLERRAELR